MTKPVSGVHGSGLKQTLIGISKRSNFTGMRGGQVQGERGGEVGEKQLIKHEFCRIYLDNAGDEASLFNRVLVNDTTSLKFHFMFLKVYINCFS